tara:strand:+ start:1014 stop:1169 length:156 start_codon:yes stop_codon:yes gene_type:complete
VELHFGKWAKETTLVKVLKLMTDLRPKTKKKPKFDLGELIGQLLFDFYARY